MAWTTFLTPFSGFKDLLALADEHALEADERTIGGDDPGPECIGHRRGDRAGEAQLDPLLTWLGEEVEPSVLTRDDARERRFRPRRHNRRPVPPMPRMSDCGLGVVSAY